MPWPALLLTSLAAAASAAVPCAPTSRPIRAFNSWSAWGGDVTEADLLGAASYVAKNLAVFGYDTIVVDGGYSNGGDGKLLLTANGLPLPNATRFPSTADGHGLRSISRAVKAMGLRFGAWDIRGLPLSGVEARLPIAGAPGLTLADAASYARNCSWDAQVLGTNAPSAAASAWYASLASYYSAQELDFIKIDCMFPGTVGGEAFYEDVEAFGEAFSTFAPAITISWSPGDGMSLANGSYIASYGGKYGVAYRVTPDFHDYDGWPRLQRQLDTAARFAHLIGVNGTFPESVPICLRAHRLFPTPSHPPPPTPLLTPHLPAAWTCCPLVARPQARTPASTLTTSSASS
jgi:alpha-galactosidase